MTGQLSCLLALALTLLAAATSAQTLEVVNQWNLLTFDLPPGYPSRAFVPENTVFTGITVTDDRIFLAMPRLRTGIPATIAWIPRSEAYLGSAPTLRAFPSWDWHSAAANCSGIISVYRTRLDRCGRLWVLDAGVIDSIDNFTTVCPPKLLVFDLKSDRLLRSITFPQEVLRANSLLTNLAIDDQSDQFSAGESCDDVFVYMSDTAAPAIVVYDSARDTAWRVTHAAMWPDPDHATYQIAGDSFTLMDGIIGLALSPPAPQRLLYFQPLATDRLFSVPTSALRAGPPQQGQTIPVSLVGQKSSQGAALAVSDQGALLFSPLTETALASWDPLTNANKVLSFNPDLLQFVPDISLPVGEHGTMYLLSTRFQKYFLRTWNSRETNMRIMRLNPGFSAPRGLIGNILNYFKK